MSINKLKSIFSRGIYPFEEIIVKDQEYITVSKKISDEEQYFIQKMSLDDVKRFEEFKDLFYHSSSIYASECFTYGFQLGTRLMAEVFTDEK